MSVGPAAGHPIRVALPLLAAPPGVTDKGAQIEIALPAGNIAVWVAWDGAWFTGAATDTDRDGRIVVDAGQLGSKWIVADAQTGEWTIESRMSQAPLPAGTILPVTGENEVLEMFELRISCATPVKHDRDTGVIHDDEIAGPRRRTSRH